MLPSPRPSPVHHRVHRSSTPISAAKLNSQHRDSTRRPLSPTSQAAIASWPRTVEAAGRVAQCPTSSTPPVMPNVAHRLDQFAPSHSSPPPLLPSPASALPLPKQTTHGWSRHDCRCEGEGDVGLVTLVAASGGASKYAEQQADSAVGTSTQMELSIRICGGMTPERLRKLMQLAAAPQWLASAHRYMYPSIATDNISAPTFVPSQPVSVLLELGGAPTFRKR